MFSAPPPRRLLEAGWQSGRIAAHNDSKSHAPAKRLHPILEHGWIRHPTSESRYRTGAVRSGRNQGRRHSFVGRSNGSRRASLICRQRTRPTRYFPIFDEMPSQGCPVSLFGRKGIRNHCLKGGENSGESLGAAANGLVDVEDFETAFDWKVGVVCANGEASAATRYVFCLPIFSARAPTHVGAREKDANAD